MAVGRHIHTKNDTREVHMHPRIKTPDEAAAALTEVSTEAVERHTEGRDVKDIPDEKALTVQRDDGRAPAKNWSIRVVSHPNAKVADRLVRYEGRPIREHMVRGPSIRHNETERITWRDGPE